MTKDSQNFCVNKRLIKKIGKEVIVYGNRIIENSDEITSCGLVLCLYEYIKSHKRDIVKLIKLDSK